MFIKKTKKIYSFLVLLAIFIFMIYASLTFDFEPVLEYLGVTNVFIVLFIISLFGGISFIGFATFISTVTVLVSNGFNPLYIGLVGGFGFAIGDVILISLLIGGRQLLSGKLSELLHSFANTYKRQKIQKYTTLFVYLYVSFLPLPNDVLFAFLTIIEYPYRKVILIIIFGNITFTLLAAHIIASSIN